MPAEDRARPAAKGSMGTIRLRPQAAPGKSVAVQSAFIRENLLLSRPIEGPDSMRRSLLPGAVLAAIACIGGSGCYSYAKVPVENLTPDMSVQLELSAVAVDRLRHGP